MRSTTNYESVSSHYAKEHLGGFQGKNRQKSVKQMATILTTAQQSSNNFTIPEELESAPHLQNRTKTAQARDNIKPSVFKLNKSSIRTD